MGRKAAGTRGVLSRDRKRALFTVLTLLFLLCNYFFWYQFVPYWRGKNDAVPHIKNKYKNKILVSVIIPTYDFDDAKLHRAMNSVAQQEPLPPLVKFVLNTEIIVVNDGSSEEHFKTFARNCELKNPASKNDVLNGYKCKVGNHVVRFVSNPVNEGLGGARNFGIKYAKGKWVLPLDADDEIQPQFFSEVLVALHSKSPSLTLHNPGNFNVIMPGMANHEGKALSWQPSSNTTDLIHANVFHCCGLYLKAIHDSGIIYDKMMLFGWEDWDFWIKLDDQIGIDALMVNKPLYKYNIGEDKAKNSSHLSKFCVTHRDVCVAHLRLNNPCLYEKQDVIKAFEIIRNFFQQNEHIPKWSIVEGEAKKGVHLAKLLIDLKSHLDLASSKRYFDNYYELLCTRASQQCESAYYKLVTLADAQERSEKMTLFHIIVTKVGSNALWSKILRHVVVAILDFHSGATLIIHSNLDLDLIFDATFLNYYQNRIFVSPIHCHSMISKRYGMGHIDKFINRHGNGRPNYYSHFTDYFRFLLLYSFGGIYLDTDILLRQSVSHLRNFAAREDENYVNGAFLSFDRFSPVMKHCLDQIPLVYDAFIWGIIGPDLITTVSKIENSDQKWIFNVLDRKGFYDINWEDIVDLVSKNISAAEYNHRRVVNYGYHFWGKVFYKNYKSVNANSLLGRSLQNTCRPSIMSCAPLN